MRYLPSLRLLSLSVLLLVVGCGGPPQPVSPEQIMREGKEEPPDQTAIAVLDALTLSGEQRQRIVKLRDGLSEQLAPVDQARSELVAAVVADINAGRLDRGRLDPMSRSFVQSAEQATPHLLTALDELHAILRKDQRQALVDGIVARNEERMGEGREQVKRLVKALDLTFSQKRHLFRFAKDTLSGQKERFERLRDELRAAADAFITDDFDAHGLAVVQDLPIKDWLEASLLLVEAIVRELEPAQLRTFAAIVQQRLAGNAEPSESSAPPQAKPKPGAQPEPKPGPEPEPEPEPKPESEPKP